MVSVICLSYNHERFVGEALQSIFDQTYSNIEIIVYDDASEDDTVREIEKAIEGHHNIKFLKSTNNLGNCRAFNKAFAESTGAFLIDLAADDLLMPERVAAGVADFLEADEDVGVQYGRAEMIDEEGNLLDRKIRSSQAPVDGDVYLDVIQRYFINPTTMMIRRGVLEQMGGYNEQLTYEDFDFWIRSARTWKYKYRPEVLTRKRQVKRSLSSKQFQAFSRHQKSTLAVCQTILALNHSREEDQALRGRVLYEIRRAIGVGNLHLVPGYLAIYARSFR